MHLIYRIPLIAPVSSPALGAGDSDTQGREGPCSFGADALAAGERQSIGTQK